MALSRRKFIGSSAAAAAFTMVPVTGLECSVPAGLPLAPSPDSNFGGVQIGAITYSWRSMPGGVDNIIKYCKETGFVFLNFV